MKNQFVGEKFSSGKVLVRNNFVREKQQYSKVNLLLLADPISPHKVSNIVSFSTSPYYGLQFTLRNIIKNNSLVQTLKTNLNHDNERYIMQIDD